MEKQASGGAVGFVSDESIQLIQSGITVGNSKSGIGGAWGVNVETSVYGNNSDVWGSSLTASDINNSNFGVRFRIQNSDSTSRNAFVGYIIMRVYY